MLRRQPDCHRCLHDRSERAAPWDGPIPSALLAGDVAALIDGLTLDRPLICGFSDGGETATLVGIRNSGSVRAIVNHGGYDLFNPDPQAPAMTRQMPGGSTVQTVQTVIEFFGRL